MKNHTKFDLKRERERKGGKRILNKAGISKTGLSQNFEFQRTKYKKKLNDPFLQIEFNTKLPRHYEVT